MQIDREGATFFVCEAKSLQEMADGGMLYAHPGGLGKRVTQLEQRDVRVLIYQFAEKRLMRRELTCATRSSLRRGINPPGQPNLARPTRTRRR